MAALLEEMGRFYGADGTEPAGDRVRLINEAVFSAQPRPGRCWHGPGARPTGIAAYWFLWPAIGLTRSLYLKKRRVADAYRRQGVGKLLMQAVYDVAGKHGCSRVEWTTDIGPALRAQDVRWSSARMAITPTGR